MSDKYYTPEITEFYTGFECEFKNDQQDNTWRHVVSDIDLLGIVYDSYEHQDFSNEFRVKYLDKEDIESLGFEHYKRHAGTTTDEFQSKESRYLITFDSNFSTKWNCTVIDEVDFQLFHGFIRNKSEFKKLLKQLNIYD